LGLVSARRNLTRNAEGTPSGWYIIIVSFTGQVGTSTKESAFSKGVQRTLSVSWNGSFSTGEVTLFSGGRTSFATMVEPDRGSVLAGLLGLPDGVVLP